MRIGIEDSNGKPLPGHAIEDCDPLFGDGIDEQVTWHGTGDLQEYARRTVRLRFQIRDADLFAFQFIG